MGFTKEQVPGKYYEIGMNKLLLVMVIFYALAGTAEAQTNKSYSITHTIRLRRTSQEYLFQKVQDWVGANLPPDNFTIQDIEPAEAYLFGRGTNVTNFGTVTYDLTFYVKDNVVDVIADNVKHTKTGRKPRRIRGKGTPKEHTQAYLNNISTSLRQYLL